MIRPLLRAVVLATISGVFLFPASAPAALLVYEGFVGYTAANLDLAGAPNANTIGLDTTVEYAGTSIASYTLVGTSLSFGSRFTTNGGSVSVAGATAVAAAKLKLNSPPGSPYTGTLFSSYLINITSRATSGSNLGGGIRVATDTGPTNEHFLNYADNRTSGNNVAAGYDDGTNISGSAALGTGTTYLMLSRFTLVGSATGSATATTWAFTQAQYESFLDLGGTEAVLLGLTATGYTAKATDTATLPVASNAFSDSTYEQIVNAGLTAQWDEIRYATTVEEVTGRPIPEPATSLLALLGLALLHRRRRRA
jgi:hypothetical protein